MKKIMLGIIWRDKKRASWIRKQIKVDILTTMTRKNCTWAGQVMHQTDIIWTVGEWQSRNGKKKAGQTENQMCRRDCMFCWDVLELMDS